ncbi:MAG: hypothetical protein KAS32_30955 [Candidatus Peribacteraceae bacterium]|nr:hypothetical protein [Candidatus Peribacteraceae bacterium]
MTENKFKEGDEVRLDLTRKLTSVHGVIEYASDSANGTPLYRIVVTDVFFSTEERITLLKKVATTKV